MGVGVGVEIAEVVTRLEVELVCGVWVCDEAVEVVLLAELLEILKEWDLNVGSVAPGSVVSSYMAKKKTFPARPSLISNVTLS